MSDVSKLSKDAVRSILIVGGGSSGWMVATMLASSTPREVKVTLVESDAIGIIGVGEATIPPIQRFNRRLGLDEREFMKATMATFKLGIEFVGWSRIGDRYMHPFGQIGRELDAFVPLHHWWQLGCARNGTDYPAWDEMFVTTAAAYSNRLALPETSHEHALMHRAAHAYHFDAQLYAAHLRKAAESRGVERVEGRVQGAQRNSGGDQVAAVLLQDGRRLEADLFIDCSGFMSLLLGGEIAEPFLDWSKWLPADRALAVPTKRPRHGLRPYTTAIAHSVGWQWRIPLQHRTGNGHVFSSHFSNEADAEKRLLSNLDETPLDHPRLLKFNTGTRTRHWVANVVAVGLAAGFIEPLESTSIHLVQASLERLIALFPTRRMESALRDRFNEQTRREWERVRDFVIAHYHLNQRQDSEFWRYTRAMELPESLVEILELWQGRGVLDVDPAHLFQMGSWSSILIGQNCLPATVNPLTERIPRSMAAEKIKRLAQDIREAVDTLPLHHEFIAQHCAPTS